MHKACRTLGFAFLALLCFAVLGSAQQTPPAPSNDQSVQTQPSSAAQSQAANEALTPESQDRLVREVRHELIMLPYYGVFDNLVFRIDGRTVTLEGQVVEPVVKSDAGNSVKRIEGVEKVVNNIDVLPPSPMDDRIRRAVYRSIYSYGPLFKYGGMAVPPIHIIVKGGRVTLEGVVDNEIDKNLAGMRANQVPGTFQMTNNLRVVNSSRKKK
ncbi:MAG: BON domain-containing protein [Candidatus Korobacteraceae bacterium]|jgi:hyperosmotically inducible protein